MSHKHSKAGDKLEQLWGSIAKEKLDSLRWVLLHSGINVAKLQNDEGRTALQVAAMGDRHKSLLVMLDLFRQKRELEEAIDVADDEDRTPLMMAAAAGAVKCVEHLLYYKASITRKSAEGLTARDYAVKFKRTDCVAAFDEEAAALKEAASGGGAAAEEAVDADGLTSTQRNRLKKKQLRDADRNGIIASVAAAAAALHDPSAPPGEEGGAASSAAPAGPVANEFGLLPLGPPPAAAWPEVRAAMLDRRRELHVDRVAAAKAAAAAAADAAEGGDGSGGAASSAAPAPRAGMPPLPGGAAGVDLALFHCSLVNRLELRVGPALTALPAEIGHLVALQTLILVDNALISLPESLAALVDLRHLDVQRNALAVLPAALGRLSRLEVLCVADNRLTGLEPLAPLTTLLTLNADRNEIADIAPLNYGGLARLETLSLSGNRLTELPEQIGELKALAVLNVADNAITELPAGLAGLTVKKVRELRLLPNPIADKKVLKVLNADRPEKVVKELFKLLEAGAGSGGKKGGRR